MKYTTEKLASLKPTDSHSLRYWRSQARQIFENYIGVSEVEIVRSGRKTDSEYVGQRGEDYPPEGVYVIIASTGGKWGKSRRDFRGEGIACKRMLEIKRNLEADKEAERARVNDFAQHTIIITPKQGFTGKDHLLPEIARQAQEQMKAGYSSVSAARKSAERAWFRVCASRDLYRGCEAGFGIA